MSADSGAILKLEVPVIVQIAVRSMSIEDVVKLSPGSIIELPKNAEDELAIVVIDKAIGCGRAVKVGENFGVRITFVGDLSKYVPPPPAEKAKKPAIAAVPLPL